MHCKRVLDTLRRAPGICIEDEETHSDLQMALENRKRSGEDIRQLAIKQDLIDPTVSLSTIYRALNKTGWRRGRQAGRTGKQESG